MSRDVLSDGNGEFPCGCAVWQSMSARIGFSPCALHAEALELREALEEATDMDVAKLSDADLRAWFEYWQKNDARPAVRRATALPKATEGSPT